MSYSIDRVYSLVGRDDKIAGLEFVKDSESFKEFGRYITVLFIYTQQERQELEKIFNEGTDRQSFSCIKAKYFLDDLTNEQTEKLLESGINCVDIHSIFASILPEKNTFFSTQKRKIKKIEISLKSDENGNDFGWMYGFLKSQITEGHGQPPYYLNFYYACKLFFEPDKITEKEKNIIFQGNGILNTEIEAELLNIKHNCQKITPDELMRGFELFKEKERKAVEILSTELISAGTSIKKLIDKDPKMTEELLFKILHFKDKHLNSNGKIPIYIDIYGFLHIYFRHVEEFQISEHYAHKDKFQWDEADVISVVQLVIESVNDEAQLYWENHPGARFSKYGKEIIYFEGDYYTFHIEGDGRLNTFYKNKKVL